MFYMMVLLMVLLVLGLIAVASNPAPYYAALGLVLVAAVGCCILVWHGGSFLSLVLFMIYLGGMLVVFAYSAALAAEPYPESWFDLSVLSYVLVYVLGVVCVGAYFSEGWYSGVWVVVDELKEFSSLRGDFGGVALMYSMGGWMLMVCGWMLLLTLFVVLELTRGLARGALRAV
uniref:NADH-ubiquinone oxidoreductase chain 6 n=1 Tax=Scleropages jardinii TaxID=113541 RepID=U5T6T9_9TELE|nr:NADH dehydrogenase subunit 6 [Scleropages jardinii]AGY95392.1 NADH dehydrogenase subunit 6 [Scleropages jardinii]UNI92173.1 NADH dehydrogenase subunit 6 [Scleropages jardinii]UNI92186.1 NADH dehydrogenase subunit 6 [Scleropages jardinii]